MTSEHKLSNRDRIQSLERVLLGGETDTNDKTKDELTAEMEREIMADIGM